MVTVSILVLVEVLPWDRSRQAWVVCPGVSILVLVEVLPWVNHHKGGVSCRQSFNPCSGGSIALGSALSCRFAQGSESFNPCSGGSIALGKNDVHAGAFRLMFQSLFWWKYCPGIADGIAGAGRIAVSILVLVEVLPWARWQTRHSLDVASFQSLFWWKYCPGSTPPPILKSGSCFNPCSGGSIALGNRGTAA